MPGSGLAFELLDQFELGGAAVTDDCLLALEFARRDFAEALLFAMAFAVEGKVEQAVQDPAHLHLERVRLGVLPDLLCVAVARLGDVQAQFS